MAPQFLLPRILLPVRTLQATSEAMAKSTLSRTNQSWQRKITTPYQRRHQLPRFFSCCSWHGTNQARLPLSQPDPRAQAHSPQGTLPAALSDSDLDLLRNMPAYVRPGSRSAPKLSPTTSNTLPYGQGVQRAQQEQEHCTQQGQSHQQQQQPETYSLLITCKKCTHRSAHHITKQAYHHGSVLVQCPGCKNRHLIADHLRVFTERGITLEEILQSKGEVLRKVGLDYLQNGEQGDLQLFEHIPIQQQW